MLKLILLVSLINIALGQIDFGLVNYWPMSSMEDVVGKANLFGGSGWSFTNDRFNNPSSAIYLNNGYLQVPPGVYFNGDFTFSCWANFKSNIKWGRIIDFANGPYSNNVEIVFHETTQKLTACVFDGTQYLFVDTPNVISLNTWMHIAYVQQNTTMSVFINGVLVNMAASFAPKGVFRTLNYIGKSNYVGDPNTDSIYDDIKIFNRALNSYEIQIEFNSTSVQKSAPNLINPINYWSFDNNIMDKVGQSHLYNGVNYQLVNDRFNNPNSAVSLSIGYLQVPPGVYFNGNFSFSGWFNLRSLKTFARIFDFGNGMNADNVLLATLTNNLVAAVFSGDDFRISPTYTLQLNVWYHFAFVLQGTSGSIYLNGSLIGSGTTNVPRNLVRSSNFIGRSNWYKGGDPDVDAVYDDFKIFNVALNSNQVSKEFQASATPLVKPAVYLQNNWNFNGHFNDIVSSANLFGGANYQLVADRFGNPNSAVSLINGYLQAPAGIYFDGDFTVSAWVNFRTWRNFERIFDFGNGMNADNVLLFIQTTTFKVFAFTFNASSCTNQISTPNSINLGTWYYVAFVTKNTNGSLYINGQLVISGTLNKANSVLRANNYIGRSNWFSAGYDQDADATYDDIKIYKGALSSAAILDEYNSGLINPITKTTTTTSTSTTVALISTSTTTTTLATSSTSITTLAPSSTSKTTLSPSSTSTTTPAATSPSTAAPPSSASSTFLPILTTNQSTTDAQAGRIIDGGLFVERNLTESNYIGCFKDKYQRDLDGLYIDHDGINTPQKCIDACAKYNFKYAAVQYEYQCWCGDEYGKYGRAENCNQECPRDTAKICGGRWSNSVYEIINIDSFQSKFGCNGQILKLECPAGLKINVRYAMYGRVSQSKCRFENFRKDKCMSDLVRTTSILKNRCDFKNTCELNVDEQTFSSRCKGIYKYLDSKYECV